ncbi:MAG: peptidyl-prolyl cis-trans isomerase [candidate division WOR-3 bacterium]
MKRSLLYLVGTMIVGCTPGLVRNPDLSLKYPEAAKAKSSEMKEDYFGAEQAYKSLAQKNLPGIERFWVLVNMADLYYDKLGQPEKAAEALEEAGKILPERNPLQDEVLYRKGLCLEMMGKTVDAAKAFEQVATQFRQSPWSQDALDGVERVFERNFKEYAAAMVDPRTGDTIYITKLQVDKALDQIPPMYRPRYETPEGKVELVERLLDEELSLLEGAVLRLDTLPDVIKEIKRAKVSALQRVYYTEEIQAKVEIADKEIKKYYMDHKEEFKQPGQARVKRVVLKSQDEANQVAGMIKAGESVDSLANQMTLFKHEAGRGGEFIVYSTQDAYKLFYDGVMALKDSVGVVQVDDTLWAAVRVLEKKEPGYKTVDEVRSQIIRNLRSDKERAAWDARKADLRKKYGVKVMIDTLTQELPETLAVITLMERAITKKDFEDKLSEIPPMFKARYEQPSGRLMLVENMIDEIIVTADANEKKMYLKSSVVSEMNTARKRALMGGYYATQIRANVQVSQDEIAKYYKDHKEDFRVPAQVKCQRIVVRDKRQANEVLAMVKKGDLSFDSLAIKFSILQGEARRGGEVTVFEKQEPINFYNEVSKKKAGWLGIVPFADTAWAVVKVKEVQKASYRPLEEVSPQIERTIRAEKEKDLAFRRKDELKKKYSVVLYIEPTQGTEESPQPTPPEK